MLSLAITAAVLLGGRAPLATAEPPPAAQPRFVPRDAPWGSNTTSPGERACDALVAAGLSDRVLLAASPDYEAHVAYTWAMNLRLRPSCFLVPRSAAELSAGLTTLLGVEVGGWDIAVRSGGHGGIPGMSGTASGVTIDLSALNTTTYDAAANVASIGSGGRWRDVYAELGRHGVAAAGGRDGSVGVGGFLLGGGISYYSGRVGMGCDSVINYEVVLANGSIVNANASNHSDLFRALKGGGGNFGIVTRFDVRAVKGADLWYDRRLMAADRSDAVADMLVKFADQNQTWGDDHVFAFWAHDPSAPGWLTGGVHVNTRGRPYTGSAWAEVEGLPVIANATGMMSMAVASDGAMRDDSGRISLGLSNTFKNDARIVRFCTAEHEALVSAVSEAMDPSLFSSLIVLQPLPAYMGALGQAAGGNVLGMEDTVHENALILAGGLGIDPKASDAAVEAAAAAVKTMSDRIDRFVAQAGGGVAFRYMNYAMEDQNPLGSYGEANVRFMKDVAARYDPDGVFQTRVPGGFKISKTV
ncbi:FAD-binding PCMH-type domain-containing protein [Madurella fahalii]|uniref:FAD-binding PCMH-type domain-containing protein n=1 Tax=Madurella fahalii TaxID=1157608 RepID=A0ABQ0GCJ8_9PEZI